MADIKTAIINLQDDLRTIAGMRDAPYEPPDNIQHYPFCVVYPSGATGTIGAPAGQYRIVYELIIEVHVARKDMPRDYSKTAQHLENVMSKLLAEPTLGAQGTIVTEFGDTISAQWGVMQYGESQVPETIGWQIRVPFKIISS
jgi:hypothetical protein